MRRGNAHFPTKIRGQNNDRIHRKYFSPRLLRRSDQGATNMCRAVEQLVKDERIDTIRALMENMKWSAEQAMAGMGLAEVEWPKYKQLLEGMRK